jgi:phosphoribosylformimino-5-aminoimidazole carboxamide ribotide isomerase
VVFSLDLRRGEPLRQWSKWLVSPHVIVDAVATMGITRLIVLDLARVGVPGGTGTEALCARLAADFPQVEVIAGGGVRNPSDLFRLRDCGVKGVLIASALHDGQLGRDDIADFTCL